MDCVQSSGVDEGVDHPGLRVRDFIQKPLVHEILASAPGRKFGNRPFLRVSRLGAPPDKPGYKGYFGGCLFSSRDRSGPITRWKLIERLPPSCARPSSRLTNGPKWIGGFEVAVVAMTNRTEQMSIEDAIRVMLAGYEFRYDLPPEVMDAIDDGLIDTGDDRWMWSDNVEKTNHLALTPAGWKMAQQLGLVST